MTYLLDTDHFSVLQRIHSQDFRRLSERLARYDANEFAVSIVTFHELVLGANKVIESSPVAMSS